MPAFEKVFSPLFVLEKKCLKQTSKTVLRQKRLCFISSVIKVFLKYFSFAGCCESSDIKHWNFKKDKKYLYIKKSLYTGIY